jgi:hypothetical protein
VPEQEATLLDPPVPRAWFGFRRRSNSPGRSQLSGLRQTSCSPAIESRVDDLPEGTFNPGLSGVLSDNGSDAIEVSLADLEKQNEFPERRISEGGTISSAVSPGRNTSWFSLLRSKSPSVKDPQDVLGLEEFDENFKNLSGLPSERPEDVCLAGTETTTMVEDDWLQEVVDANSVLSIDEVPSSVDLSWLQNDQCTVSPGKSGTGPKTQSSWFGFKRSKTGSRKVSRLAAASELIATDPRKPGRMTDSNADLTMDNVTRPADAWPKDSEGRDMQSSHLSPSWYANSSPPQIHAASSNCSLISDVIDNEGAHDNFFPGRARLSTESTLPTVATEERDADDSEDYDDDFDKGMEQNFAFLEI